MEKIIVEKTASRGIATAKIYKYESPDLAPAPGKIGEDAISEELGKFSAAREAVIAELSASAEGNEIFAAHLEIAKDFTLRDGVERKIREGHQNAQAALQETIDGFAAIFSAMEDGYMRERGADVRDIGKRMMGKLKGAALPDLGAISGEVIVAARNLYPSDTVKMDPAVVKGILTEEGGIASHVYILAKSLDIPILVGVEGILAKLSDGMEICMDAENGIIIIEPDEETKQEYRQKQESYEKERARLAGLRGRPAVTRDGKRIMLCANAGSVADIVNALPMNIDGVGLFRSELLYMESSHSPTEEEQFAIYREAARLCPGELTIRTLDIGGDKVPPYFSFGKEENPFLGYRAIRISLDRKDMFKEQLRAILRASASGHVRILFPMIISIGEFRDAKEITEECKRELAAAGIPFDEGIRLGMMMETPASVLLAEDFAKEADFFSIGTNDLTQYLLAVDRGNAKIAGKYDYFHPAVLKGIGQIIAAGHKQGIKVGMCGEMAGDKDAVPWLLRMGLDEFSMPAGNIDYVREQILKFSL